MKRADLLRGADPVVHDEAVAAIAFLAICTMALIVLFVATSIAAVVS